MTWTKKALLASEYRKMRRKVSGKMWRNRLLTGIRIAAAVTACSSGTTITWANSLYDSSASVDGGVAEATPGGGALYTGSVTMYFGTAVLDDGLGHGYSEINGVFGWDSIGDGGTPGSSSGPGTYTSELSLGFQNVEGYGNVTYIGDTVSINGSEGSLTLYSGTSGTAYGSWQTVSSTQYFGGTGASGAEASAGNISRNCLASTPPAGEGGSGEGIGIGG
jgi:hypothetical protein